MRLFLMCCEDECDSRESKETGCSSVYRGRGRKGSTANHMRCMGRVDRYSCNKATIEYVVIEFRLGNLSSRGAYPGVLKAQ